ncbi:acyltransferase LovD [Cladorrhinum sp. PSN259]|nr:acyltransferase LovD [Cladorrhinum sp. PSN259]
MPTPEFEARIQRAVDEGVIPGAVMLAKSKDGKLSYSKALGHATLPPSSPTATPLKPSTTLTLASMTKLLTSISILQLIERGLTTLDTDVSALLPELAAQPVLAGFDSDDNPILLPRKNPILLRHLVSHSSGAGYVFLAPELHKYFDKTGRQIPMPLSTVGGKTVAERFGYPLLFEPGQGWAYGSGMDWAGELVRRLTGGKGLDSWVRENISDKVGVREGGITFYPGRYEENHLERASMNTKNAETGKFEGVKGWNDKKEEGDETGGEGVYADMESFMLVLESLLKDDGKLLKKGGQAVDMLFEGLLSGKDENKKAHEALKDSVRDPGWIVGWVPDNGEKYDWSVGGLVTTDDAEDGGRKKGFLQWGGVFNLAWYIDRTAGVTAIFATQILQPADPLVKPLMKDFEDEIYKLLEKAK